MWCKNIAIVMIELADLFLSMQTGKRNYLQGAKGEHFEERIAHKLNQLGYSRILPGDVNNLAAKARVIDCVKQRNP